MSLLIRVTSSSYLFGIFKLFFINKATTNIDLNCIVFPPDRAGLTLRKDKHVPGASKSKGAPQKSGHKAIYFISQILGSKIPKNPKKCWEVEIKH
jgi:hypothetical protein